MASTTIRFHRKSSLPSASADLKGHLFFNSTDKHIYLCNGTDWEDYSKKGVANISESTENGKIAVNTDGVVTNVPVHGLQGLAYLDNSSSTTASINISGNAGSASKLSNTEAIGDTTHPVYFTASGVPARIETVAQANKVSNVLTIGEITFDGSAAKTISFVGGKTGNGKVNLSIDSDGKVSASDVTGLGSAAFTESTAYATAAQGVKADSAIQEVWANGTKKEPESGNIVKLTAADFGLANAMHFKGIVATKPTPTVSDSYQNGDVILLSGTAKEFVRSGKTETVAGSWVELGDETSYTLKTQGYNSTSAGVALGGTSENPSITVTPGSIESGNASVITGGAVYTAISELVDTKTGTAATDSTVTAFSEAAGKVAISFGKIQIAESQVTNLTTDLAGKAAVDHVHGNINNNGTITSSAVTPASGTEGDYLLISDTSASGKVEKGVKFTGVSNQYLNGNGEFATVTVPTVSNAKMTLKYSDDSTDSFTLNQSADKTISMADTWVEFD